MLLASEFSGIPGFRDASSGALIACVRSPAKMKKVFVLGWYDQGNRGDEAFRDSFQILFPSVFFTFGNKIPSDINSYTALWLGGGNILDAPLCAIPEDITVQVGFFGVGIGGKIHPAYAKLVSKAKVFAVRDELSATHVSQSIVLPDLTFIKPKPVSPWSSRFPLVTIFLSDHLTPQKDSPDWKSLSYQWFIHEFAACCDWLVNEGHDLQFIPMCQGYWDDRRTAAAVMGRMTRRDRVDWWTGNYSEEVILAQMAKSKFIITQRLHGAIFATRTETSFLALNAHSKMDCFLRDLKYPGLSYYGFNLSQFEDTLEKVLQIPTENLGAYAQQARDKWRSFSDIVEKIYFG